MEGNEIQIAIWPKRSRNGVRYLRVHIEPPYEGDADDDIDEDDWDDGDNGDYDGDPADQGDDDIPF